MRRFFVPPSSLDGEQIALNGDVLRHMAVLRLQAGDEVLLLDGSGRVARCRIEILEKRHGVAHCLERWQESESALPLHLLQGSPKGDKLELVLQKGTELGITRFTPVLCGRSVAGRGKGGDSRRQRWQKVVVEAARQCRRPVLPQLEAATGLDEALANCREPLRLMLWEEGARPLAEVLPAERPEAVAVLVGPEGGFSAAEAGKAAAAGFLPVHLGPRILRTETAGLAIASILQYLYGDLAQLPEGD